MLTYILVALVAVVVIILGMALTKPNSFRLQRSAHIGAEPGKVFALLDDFRAWTAWSPWEKLDPALRRTYGGAASGVGATYAWEGNKKVGSGRMEIVEAAPPSRLLLKLDFLTPFEAHNMTEFTLTPERNGTTLTWTMYGPNNFMSKLMQVFISMDAMVGKDFEAGLANLKAQAEQ